MGERSAREIWNAGIAAEIEFWDRWFATRGADWPDEYLLRLDPESLLSDYYCSFIDDLPQQDIRILDVGAGPLTLLGKRHRSKRLTIVATDALAREYDRLLEKYDVHPPVRTVFAEAEKLCDAFPPDTFDLVTARNCIDHTYDPLRAIDQMVRVAKDGGYAALVHLENEAETEHYEGLHQWNFTIEEGCFIIRSRHDTVNVSHRLSAAGHAVSAERAADGWIRLHIRKQCRSG